MSKNDLNYWKWKQDTMTIIQDFGLDYVLHHIAYCIEEEGKSTEQRMSEIWKQIKEYEKQTPKPSIDPLAQELKDKIKITDIAKNYGLKVKGNMAICPFHKDTNPSLSLSNEKGVFNCFGCHAKGDIVTFVKMLEDLKK